MMEIGRGLVMIGFKTSMAHYSAANDNVINDNVIHT